jgi:hypothetical protein
MKAALGMYAIFDGYYVLKSVDDVPLDTFTSGGAETVVSLFGLWGLSQLLFGVLLVLVLIRYRAMIPLMYVLLLVEYLSKKATLLMNPIVTTKASSAVSAAFFLVATPAGLVLVCLVIAGLVFSLLGKGYLPRHESVSA